MAMLPTEGHLRYVKDVGPRRKAEQDLMSGPSYVSGHIHREHLRKGLLQGGRHRAAAGDVARLTEQMLAYDKEALGNISSNA